jgi:hypothetical protein
MPERAPYQVLLTIETWEPLHGTFSVEGRSQPPREFFGWIGLAAGLTAIEHGPPLPEASGDRLSESPEVDAQP